MEERITQRSEHRRAPLGWAALACAAALFLTACFVLWSDEPFDASKAGRVAGDQFGYSVRAFDAHGYLALRGASSTLYFPEHSNAHRAPHFTPYLHHPLPAYGMAWLSHRWFGGNEAALRWPFAVAALLACFALWRLVRLVAAARTAALAVLLFALQPGVVQYGNMVDTLPLALCSMLWCVHAWISNTASARRVNTQALLPAAPCWRYAVPAFLCGMVSWYGYPLVLALWADIALAGPTLKHRWRRAFFAGLPFGVALLVHIGWLTWALGGAGPMLQQAQWLLGAIAGADMGESHPSGLDTPAVVGLARSWVECGTWPLVLLALIGIGCALVARRKHAARLATRATVILLLAGLMPGLVFWSRACVHEFFAVLLAPALAFLAAQALCCVSAAWTQRGADSGNHNGTNAQALRWPVLAAALLLAAFMAREGVLLHDSFRADGARQEAAALDATFGPRDVVLVAAEDSPSGLRYYSRCVLLPGLGAPAVFDWMIAQLRPAAADFDNLWLVASDQALLAMPYVKDLPLLLHSAIRIPATPRPLMAVKLDRTKLGL